MSDLQKHQDPVRPARTLEDIETTRDPITRATELETAVRYLRTRLARAVRARDKALREAKTAGASMPSIAQKTGINLATIKVVTRGDAPRAEPLSRR